MSRITRQTSRRKNSQECESCQDEQSQSQCDEGKVLRSGRKIESAPSSQEDNDEVGKKTKLEDLLQSLTFIQCEYESCLKWRKITQGEAEKYQDKKWFCRMNKNDPDHCRCDQPEEDQFVQLAESSGYRYTFSTLPCGALVWARMPGHVQWPAIISLDPDTKECFWKEGLAEYYHVEFLGKRRTHQWLSPLYVDPYGNGRKPQFPQDPKNKKGRKRKIQSRAENLLRSKAYQKSFDFAVREAESFRKLSNEKRIEKCVYIPKTPKVKREVKPKVKNQVRLSSVATRQKRTCEQKVANKHSPKSLEEGLESSKPTYVKKKKKCSPRQNGVSKCRKKLFKSKKDIRNLSQVLLQEERLFNGAWAHFMKSRELVFDRKLSFNGSSLSAFRLFMSVQERGGYNEMTFSDWEAIASELSKKSTTDKCQASLLKKLFKRNLLPYEKHLLPGKQDDTNNNEEDVTSKQQQQQQQQQPTVSAATAQQHKTLPQLTGENRYAVPSMNMQQMLPPFVKTDVGRVAPAYATPYSLNNNCLPGGDKHFRHVPSTIPLSSSYYGVNGGTNCGSYQVNWSMPPAGGNADKSLNKGPASVVADVTNQTCKEHKFKEPYCPQPPSVVMSSSINSRTSTSFSNYGNSSRGISSVIHTNQWRNYPPTNAGRELPLKRPQFNEPRSQTGWPPQGVSSDFDKDMLEIDNIIEALDKTRQWDSALQSESFKPAGIRNPASFAFYGTRYERLQPKKMTDMDDAQCVPDTAIQGSLYPRRDRMIASPVAYAYPSNLANPTHIGATPNRNGDPTRPVTSAGLDERNRVELLTRETSRLDDELQMEFSEL